ncbi:unnamed protein product, partial [Porites evermanni]
VISGILPSNWRRYTVPKGLTVLQWVADFSDRIKQLQKISHAANTGGAKGLKSGKLHTYPSPKPTLTVTSHLGQNLGLGEGVEPGTDHLLEGKVTLPVYLNQTRTELLFTVDMATRGEPAGREHRFYERGVAFLASSLSG